MALHTINTLSLTTGYAGIELGLELAGKACGFETRTVCYVEREAFAVANLVAKMEEGWLDKAPVWSDVTTFDPEPWRGRVDCITGGFPCQPWSKAGQRKGTDDERWLWGSIERLVREIRPGFVFLENVPGLLAGGIEHVLGSLASLGYDAEWEVFSAAQLGASHRRERVFILAYRRWEPVVFADELPLCDCCEEPWCPIHNQHYWECPCIGPTEDGWVYEETPRGLVAYAEGERVQGLWTAGDTELRTLAQTRLPDSTCDAPFPPGPSELRLEDEPQPCIPRTSHGIADWVDRVFAIGNGVVPVVAAYAFISLAKRARSRVGAAR